MFDQLYAGFQKSRFKPIAPMLPIESYAVGDGFRMGLPWPWFQAEPIQLPRDAESLLAVEVPRTDYQTQFSMWRTSDTTQFDQLDNSVGGQLAQLYQGRLVGRRKILLHGARAVLVAVDGSVGGYTWRLVADWQSLLIHGELSVPVHTAAGYEPHLETMLATWEWT
jgi:hypothetical protein